MTFSYVSFDLDRWEDVVASGIRWIERYKERTGFAPTGLGIYFNTQNDQSIAPHSGKNGGTVFSFDPIYNRPKD